MFFIASVPGVMFSHFYIRVTQKVHQPRPPRTGSDGKLYKKKRIFSERIPEQPKTSRSVTDGFYMFFVVYKCCGAPHNSLLARRYVLLKSGYRVEKWKFDKKSSKTHFSLLGSVCLRRTA